MGLGSNVDVRPCPGRFSAQHRIHGRPDAVSKVLSDPNFYLDLELPDLTRPEVIDHRSEGNDAVLRLRYEFVATSFRWRVAC